MCVCVCVCGGGGEFWTEAIKITLEVPYWSDIIISSISLNFATNILLRDRLHPCLNLLDIKKKIWAVDIFIVGDLWAIILYIMCKYVYAVCVYQIVRTCLAPMVDRVVITAMKPESSDSFCDYWQLVQTLQWGKKDTDSTVIT